MQLGYSQKRCPLTITNGKIIEMAADLERPGRPDLAFIGE